MTATITPLTTAVDFTPEERAEVYALLRGEFTRLTEDAADAAAMLQSSEKAVTEAQGWPSPEQVLDRDGDRSLWRGYRKRLLIVTGALDALDRS